MQLAATHLQFKTGITLGLLLAGGFCASLPSHAQTTIDTTPAWGGQSISFWGEPDTATFGQTFTAPTGVISLSDFSFYLKDDTNGSNIPYNAYVYAWDGSEATGSALYTSALSSTGTLGSSFTKITTNTGAVAVTPGTQYVAFFSTSGVQEAGPPTKLADFGYVPGSVTSTTGGSFVFLNSGNDATQFTNPGGWSIDSNDLAFTADFKSNPVPESSTALSFGLMLLGAGVLAKTALKRKASAAR